MEARQVPAGEGYLTAEAVGEIEKEDGVLVIKRIHVRYRLRVEKGLLEGKREAIDRAMTFHPDRCPVARSIKAAIALSTELEIEPL
ncbi:MAG: hypothetical protein FJ314_04415 [SAR202 cluster bacterium]|nr:hypothetical protein [SAR202 cluster bacterium]